MWELGRRLLGERAGVIAGVAAALYQPFVTHCLAFESDGLGLFLLCALAVTLARPDLADRPLRLLTAGLLLGLRVTQRPDAIVLVGLLPLAWWALTRPRPRLSAALRGWGVFAVAAALVVLPVTWQNYRVAHELIPVTDAGGIGFYASNAPEATGLGYYPPGLARELMARPLGAGEDPAERMDGAVARRLASLVGGAALSPRQASRFWFREGVRVARERGLGQIRLEAAKLRFMLHRFEAHDNPSLLAVDSRLAPFSALGMGTLAPFGLIGLALALRPGRRPPLLWLPLALLAVPLLTMGVFHVAARYRLELAALLLPFAALALRRLVDPGADRRSTLALLAALAALALLSNLDDRYLREQRAYRRILLSTERGLRTPDPRVAVATLRAATEQSLHPAQAEPAYRRLAELYRELGNPVEAERCTRIGRRSTARGDRGRAARPRGRPGRALRPRPQRRPARRLPGGRAAARPRPPDRAAPPGPPLRPRPRPLPRRERTAGRGARRARRRSRRRPPLLAGRDQREAAQGPMPGGARSPGRGRGRAPGGAPARVRTAAGAVTAPEGEAGSGTAATRFLSFEAHADTAGEGT